MLLSIIIPTYNSINYISDSILTIQKQGDADFEVLYIDNNSTDGSAELIQELASKSERIRLISGPDKGIYDAMNKGIASAKGDWLYFMGCDDVFFDDTVLRIISSNLTPEYDVVYGDVLWMPDNEPEKGECSPEILFNRNINHQRIFYRKDLFARYGGYDLQYKVAADHELNIRFFCNNTIRKKYLPFTVARYHSGGFSANRVDAVFWKDWKLIFRRNFSSHLPMKRMYEKLGWYCRYQIEQGNYQRAFWLFMDVFLHTFSFGFVLLTVKQLFNKTQNKQVIKEV
jgi:glycosyltransferase involved in cell wall biosynthesis